MRLEWVASVEVAVLIFDAWRLSDSEVAVVAVAC